MIKKYIKTYVLYSFLTYDMSIYVYLYMIYDIYIYTYIYCKRESDLSGNRL